MNRRVMLAFAAAAVIAAAVILYLAINAEDGDAAASTSGDREELAARDPATATGDRTARPALPTGDEAGSGSAAGGKPYREYVTADGRRVRDHRRHPPVDAGAGSARAPRPPGRTLDNSVTRSVGLAFKPVMKGCLKGLPSTAAGGKRARLQGELFVSIKDHQLKVDGAKLGIPQLEGDAVTEAIQCMQEKSAGITTAAPDEADLDRLAIRIDIALR